MTDAIRRHDAMLRLGIRAAACLLLGAVCTPMLWAEEDINPELLEMIVELIEDPDREIRALGLEQVREGAPGKAVTRRLAALLPSLDSQARAELMTALGDRADREAHGAILDQLSSEAEIVRAAALGALGHLGTADDVRRLVQQTVASTITEREAARNSLVRLGGTQINATLVTALEEAPADQQIEVLNILARRRANETLPSVLQSAQLGDASVRLAALKALRFLAQADDTPAVADLVVRAVSKEERLAAELALLRVCQRGREACVSPIEAAIKSADPDRQVVLVSTLARCGGPRALDVLVSLLTDSGATVRLEAIRTLSIWPDPAAMPQLLRLADSDSLRERVLAIRGVVRLARARASRPADVDALERIVACAERTQEKQLVAGALAGVPNPESVVRMLPWLANAEIANEVGMAIVLVAEQLDEMPASVVAVLRRVIESAPDPTIRQRAEKLVGTTKQNG